MGKNKILQILVCILLIGIHPYLGNAAVDDRKACLLRVMNAQRGVYEATGDNDGYKVNQYQQSTGSKNRSAWCASYVHWVLDKCGISTPINAWAPSLQNREHLIYFKRLFREEPLLADVFTIYSLPARRINHGGFFKMEKGSKFFLSNEGNWADRVAEVIRSYNTVYSISRWE